MVQSDTYILVDSGTTTTRVRVTDGQSILAVATELVGARDTARDGSNQRVRGALARLVREALDRSGRSFQSVRGIAASGMITSSVGLMEVPYVRAPAGPSDLNRGILTADFPDIAPLPIHFIPGVMTTGAGPEDLHNADILRGEEVEVTGLRRLLDLKTSATFLHCGSHHKIIRTDADGRILGSVTTMTGELLQAVSTSTVLSATVLPSDEIVLDWDSCRRGLWLALEEGFGRAAFLVRVAEQLWRYSRQQASNVLLGALAALDLPMLEAALSTGDDLVIYGNGHFPLIVQKYLEEWGFSSRASLASPEMVEKATVLGAIEICQG